MNRTGRALAAIVVVVGVVAAVASVLSIRGPATGAALQLDAAEPPVAIIAMPEVVPVPVDATRREAPATIEAAEPAAREATLDMPSRFDDDGAVTWVEGRVEVPPGTPADERVRITATEPPINHNFFPHDLGDFAVEADGRFRIPVPARCWMLELELVSRSLVLERERHVDMLAPLPDLVLRPVLAATARVRLVPSEALIARGFDVQKATVAAVEPTLKPRVLPQAPPTRVVSGAVEVGAIRPGVASTLHANAPGALHAALELRPMGSGEVREIELALDAAPRVSGTVRDERGAPVAGARVWLRTKVAGLDAAACVASADDGRFSIDATGVGEARLRVEHAGFLSADVGPWTVAAGTELSGVGVVLSSGATIAGRVLWPDGRPAAGATVVAIPSREDALVAPFPLHGVGARVATDVDGNFRLAGLEREPHTVTVLVSERLDRTARKSRRVAWTARATGLRVPAENVELVLSPGSVVRGRVVDDDGEPVANAEVVANPDASAHTDDSARSVTADASGRFELEAVRDGGWHAVARRPSAAFSEPVSFVVEAPDVPEVVIVVPRSARIAGRVLDASGVPVAGAVVDLEAGGPGEKRSWVPDGASAADGTFAVDGLPPGLVRVRARKDGYARSIEVVVELDASEPTSGVDLVLRAGGTIEGVVLAADGTPIPVETVHMSRDDMWPTPSVRTDERGRFRFEHVEPGKVWLSRAGELVLPWTVEPTVVEDGATSRVELRAR